MERRQEGGRRLEEAAAANQGRAEALTGGMGETERGSSGMWDGLEEASCAVGAEGGDAQSEQSRSCPGEAGKNERPRLEIKIWGVRSTWRWTHHSSAGAGKEQDSESHAPQPGTECERATPEYRAVTSCHKRLAPHFHLLPRPHTPAAPGPSCPHSLAVPHAG